MKKIGILALQGDFYKHGRMVEKTGHEIIYVKTIEQLNRADALIIPGGLGAAKNLCSFAFDGSQCTVNEDVKRAILAMAKRKKPIGALCIAPVILASVLNNITVTIGNSIEVAEKLKQLGARHRESSQTDIMIDDKNRIVTTPCYMYDARVDQIGEGADKLVDAILRMAGG